MYKSPGTTLVLGAAFLLGTLSPAANAFVRPLVFRTSARASRPLFYSDDYTDSEFKEMEKLIVSISKEPTDESRRERLTEVFEEALAKPNGAPKRFSNLFDQVLIVVGDRVKHQAHQLAMEQQEAAKEEEEPEVAGSGDFMEKPPVQRQLWALVDMMVQSKTIVKKASGELGSEGTFG